MTKKEVKVKKVSLEVIVPDNVESTIKGNEVSMKGPEGEVIRSFRLRVSTMKQEGKKIIIESQKDKKKDRKEAGAIQAHLKNMIRGSQEAHKYVMKICSGHFPMNVAIVGTKLVIKNFLGEKVPRTVELKAGAKVKVEGEHINISSVNKEIAGQVAADIEQITRRPKFNTRIFQDGIYIIHKDGEDLK